MKVVLIEPPQIESGNISRFYGTFGTSKAVFCWPPIELMSIAGYIRNFGVEPLIYDAGGFKKTFSDVKEYISEEKPDIVVFSTSITTIHSDFAIAKKAKEVSEKIITVAVGTHVMSMPEEVMKKEPALDIAVYGDDEEIIVKNIAQNRTDLPKVDGIVWRNHYGKIIKNSPQKLVNDLNELGFPAHDLAKKEHYYDFMSKNHPLALIMTQRGCINRCSFCLCPNLYRYRERTVEHVITELEWIKKLGYKEFKFVNAGISYNFDWINNLLDQMIKKDLNLTWWSNTRADKLNPEILLKMKSAGCHTLAIGMESADENILKNAGKNISPKQVKEAVSLIKKLGMKVMVYFIFGLPGETKKSIQKTIEFAKSLNADFVTMGVAQPLPGTKFHDYVREKGYLLTNDWEKYDPVKLPVYEYPDLPKEEIYYAARKGYRQFYLRPNYILKKIFEVRSLREFKIGFSNFLALIKKYSIPE